MHKPSIALIAALFTAAWFTSVALPPHAPQAERYRLLYRSLMTNEDTTAIAQALGNFWRDVGDLPASLPHTAAALIAAPDPARATQLANTYLALGDYAAALDVLRLAHAASPNAASVNAMLGFLYAPSDPTRALPHLRAVGFDDRYDDAVLPLLVLIRQENATASDVYSARVGAILASTGRFALAEHAYRYAVAQQPNFAEALAQIGYMASQQGRDGSVWIAQALTLDPTSPDVRLAQALVLRHAGDWQAALDALAVARLYAPSSAALYRETARTYELIGRDDLAAQWRAQAEALSAP